MVEGRDGADALALARRRNPTIHVDDEGFAAWVREHGSAEEPPDLDGLLVAYGCIVADRGALAVFEQCWMPTIRQAIARTGVADPDELAGRVREQMLLGTDGRAPKLATYRGTGPLSGFLRICAVREALMAKRRATPIAARCDDEAIADVIGLDPELELVKTDASRAFRRAFSAALAQLPDRDRNVLRYRVLDGLRGDEVARIYGVHPSRVSRWLSAARDHLLAATRQRLNAELGLAEGQFDSIMRLIRSSLDISLGDALRLETRG